MIRNYFKTAWRHLQVKKVFTFLNVLGLAVGIASCWIIYRIVHFEHSYDSALDKKGNIYQVVSVFSGENKSMMGAAASPLYQALNELPGIENIVPVYNEWVTSIEVQRNNQPFIKQSPEGIAAVTPSYFKMLTYKWLAGNKEKALSDIAGVVLTKSKADMYFPNMKPEMILNKTITYFGRDTVNRKVTGIVEDFTEPTQFTSTEFIVLKEKVYPLGEWTNTNGNVHLYLQLKNTTGIKALTDNLNKIDEKYWMEFGKERGEQIKKGRSYVLYPLKNIHFATDISDYYAPARVSKTVLNGLLGIAIFLLMLACINYINMSVAQIPQRGKDIGIRKTLGGTKGQLILQFLCETGFTVIMACLVAVVTTWLGFALLRDIIPQGVRPGSSIQDILLFGSVLLVITVICAGLYPAWLITRVKTVEVFKNFGLKNYKGFSLQKLLIVFQFVIALVFIICTVIVSSQLQFILKSDMGFNKDAVVLAGVPWQYARTPAYKGREVALLDRIKRIPGVEAVIGSEPLSQAYSSSPFQITNDKGELIKVQVFKKGIDTSYLGFYEMKLLAGRNIFPSDTLSEIILNETAVKSFGFATPEAAIGKMINQLGNAKVPVVGVIKDFHTQDFYKPIEPLAMMNNWDGLTSLHIRLKNSMGQWQQTIQKIEREWYKFYPPDTFKFKFYDESIEAIYKKERQTAKLISIAAAIMIFVSCLGLFGLATLMAWQRTKEIGIRKVLGAHVMGIVTLFVKDYVKLIIISIVIAMPIAWWAMNRWLTDFVYRVEIQWWMFALAGLATIVLAVITIGSRAVKVATANPVKSLRTE
ncbi:hypothetical protein DC498_20190 [Terrimonas sp.]|uniref:ABC transporter permease n=1 Tax=Terrimonas sp. TaxID=1914338 RepID=UPI000D5190A2|nr:ABC transporter permease [Terrimonas sp.]PVD50440.1 hypothetical protein DC498_20190 [Terrimonas sp.]